MGEAAARRRVDCPERAFVGERVLHGSGHPFRGFLFLDRDSQFGETNGFVVVADRLSIRQALGDQAQPFALPERFFRHDRELIRRPGDF